MKKNIKSLVLICICMILALTLVGENVLVNSRQVEAASSTSSITVGKYITLLTKASGAKKSDIVKEGEFTKTSSKITYEDAAVLADRADIYKNGENYSESLYDNIVSKKRISDISKATKSKREAIYRCFTKGIMVGKSNGTYSQSRKFEPKSYLTVSEANTMADRIKSKSKRIKLSYDGQVIRTTNLPKNYKSFSYILASFPNSFYEHKFMYQLISKDELKNLTIGEHYASPVKLTKVSEAGYNIGKSVKTKDGDKVIANLMTNLKCRFNYNYKTTNKKEWITNMASTFNDKAYAAKVAENYTEFADKRKVVVQSSKIVIEPSATYYYGNSVIFRGHARIKVTAGKFETWQSKDQNYMVMGRSTCFKKLKNGQWYDFDFEIAVCSEAYDQYFPDYRIMWFTDSIYSLGELRN